MSRNIFPSSVPVSLVPVSLANGVMINVQVVLDKKQTRQQQKLKTLRQYVEKYPSGWKKRLDLAKLLYGMGQWSQAVEELSQVVERRPIAVEARLLLGKLWQLTGQETEAIALYENTLPFVRDKATQYHITGLIAQCRHCPKQAVHPFERAAMNEPDNIAHWLALGKLQLSLDAPKAALRAFDTLLSLHPKELTALIYSYDTLMQLGQTSFAQERLDQASALAPKDFRVLVRLATRRCQQRLVFDKAGRQTQQLIFTVLRSTPHAAQAHYLLASYHYLREEPVQAKTVLQRFTEQYPKQPYGWVYFAKLLFKLGEAQAAAEKILKAYELHRGDRQIHLELHKILTEAGKLETLKPILKEILTVFPEALTA